MRYVCSIILACVLVWTGCGRYTENHQAVLPSPGFDVHLYFNLFKGNPYYMVFYKKQKLTGWSSLGFRDGGNGSMIDDLRYAGNKDTHDKSADAGKPLSDNFKEKKYNTLFVNLVSENEPGMSYTIEFRVYDDGFAYRYQFTSGDDLQRWRSREASEINLGNNGMEWTIRSDCDTLDMQAELLCPGPVVFKSGSGLALQLTKGEGPDDKFVLQRSDENEMAFFMSEPVPGAGAHDQGKRTSMPWRVFLIANTVSNE